MYHRVADLAVDPHGLAVSPDHFAQHLEYIRGTCHPMRLLDLVDALKEHSLPRRAVAITFDDGYIDNLTQAYPLLKSAQVPATVFVTSGGIDSSCEFFWHELERVFLLPVHLPERLQMCVQGQEYEWPTTSTEERQIAYYAIDRLLRPLAADGRDQVLAELASWAGLRRNGRPDYRPMSVAELIQLTGDRLVELGAHTITHPVLSVLSPEAQYAEIVWSRQRLEGIIGSPVLTFSYPWGEAGDFTDETVEIVEAAGFRAACTTVRGGVEPGNDLFRLRRCAVRDWDIEMFKWRLESFFVA